MSATKIWALLGAVLIAGVGVGVAGCSSDDSSNANPLPTRDGGSNQDGSTGDSGKQGDSGQSDAGSQDSGNPNCKSDAATCNSCVTAAQDPLNACSPATGNCIPFDNSRVPANVPSP